MSSKKQGDLHRMFTQPDLSKIELKSKVGRCDWIVALIFPQRTSRIVRMFVVTNLYSNSFNSSSMPNFDAFQSTAQSTQNTPNFIVSWRSYIIYRTYRLPCGTRILIENYCL